MSLLPIGTPGMTVLPCDHRILELKPFRSFRVGEVVACSLSHAEDISHTPSAEKYVYAVVMEVGDIGNEGLRKLSLKVGDAGSKVISLLCTDVYSFRSAKDPSTRQAEVRPADHSDSFAVSLKSPEINKLEEELVTFPVGVSSVMCRQEKNSFDDSDVMTASTSLLDRAGVPLSLDNEVKMDNGISVILRPHDVNYVNNRICWRKLFI